MGFLAGGVIAAVVLFLVALVGAGYYILKKQKSERRREQPPYVSHPSAFESVRVIGNQQQPAVKLGDSTKPVDKPIRREVRARQDSAVLPQVDLLLQEKVVEPQPEPVSVSENITESVDLGRLSEVVVHQTVTETTTIEGQQQNGGEKESNGSRLSKGSSESQKYPRSKGSLFAESVMMRWPTIENEDNSSNRSDKEVLEHTVTIPDNEIQVDSPANQLPGLPHSEKRQPLIAKKESDALNNKLAVPQKSVAKRNAPPKNEQISKPKQIVNEAVEQVSGSGEVTDDQSSQSLMVDHVSMGSSQDSKSQKSQLKEVESESETHVVHVVQKASGKNKLAANEPSFRSVTHTSSNSIESPNQDAALFVHLRDDSRSRTGSPESYPEWLAHAVQPVEVQKAEQDQEPDQDQRDTVSTVSTRLQQLQDKFQYD